VNGPSALGTLLVQRLDAVLGPRPASAAAANTHSRADAVKPAEAVARLAETGRQLNQDATASAPTSLGRAARTILALIARFPDVTPLVGRAPLSPASDGILPTHQFVTALRDAIQTSGIFYESHLAALAFGDKTAQQLRGEPQAALRTAVAPTNPHSSISAHSDDSGVHPEAAYLVRQQLDVLAHQVIAWRGQPWPDTTMHWEIRRSEKESSPEIESGWSTSLRLDFQRLGLLDARIGTSGDQVTLHIQPRGGAAVSAEIGAAGNALRARMGAAGLTLSNFSVAPDPLPVAGEGNIRP
jgi:hypothetical protein